CYRVGCLLFSPHSTPPPASYTLSYTTLFRSGLPHRHAFAGVQNRRETNLHVAHVFPGRVLHQFVGDALHGFGILHDGQRQLEARSEEHTSELQSRENLVCRLLLEKKKTEQQQ